MKIKKYFALFLVICTFIAVLSACSNAPSNEDVYPDTMEEPMEEAYYEEPTWEDSTSSEQVNTFSLDDTPITEEFAREVHTVMQAYSFDYYKGITSEQWKVFGCDEKNQMYEAFFGMLTELEFPVNVTKDAWILTMDEDAGFYSDYRIWGFAFENLGLYGAETLASLRGYIQGIEDGKYSALNSEIFAVADDITVEYYEGKYLLCVGGNHNIAQITKSWTTEDSMFDQSGSVTPVSTGDIFNDIDLSYYIGGSEGVFEYADIGDTDLLAILKTMGAIGDSGTMLCNQIQISAKSCSNAPKIFVLSQNDDGIITVAVLEYSGDIGMYIWDGNLLTTSERCCFDNDGNFCYVGKNGTLQSIAP